MRYVLLLIGLYLVYRLFLSPGRLTQRSKKGSSQHEAEQMHRCSVCNVYVPNEECVMVKGRYYCSLEHAQQGEGLH